MQWFDGNQFDSARATTEQSPHLAFPLLGGGKHRHKKTIRNDEHDDRRCRHQDFASWGRFPDYSANQQYGSAPISLSSAGDPLCESYPYTSSTTVRRQVIIYAIPTGSATPVHARVTCSPPPTALPSDDWSHQWADRQHVTKTGLGIRRPQSFRQSSARSTQDVLPQAQRFGGNS